MLRIFYTAFILKTILLSLIFVGGVGSLVYAEYFSSYIMYENYSFVDGNSDLQY